MSAGEFQKDSLGWQIHQLQQKLGEWWEWQMRQFNPHLPDITPPTWDQLSWTWQFIRGLMISLLIALIIWAGWRIWRLLRPYWRNLSRQTLNPVQHQNIKDLSSQEWLKRSQSYQQQGDYYQGCRCIYFAMLQRLHEIGLIPYPNTLTDGEYLDLILGLPQSDGCETLLKIHQQICFGNREASASLLATCEAAYRRIETINI